MTSPYAQELARIDDWGADHAAAAVIGPSGVLAAHGDPDHRFAWASLTKPVTAMTVLLAVERGLLDLDEPAGPPDATVRHLLAHTSGLPFEGEGVASSPGKRRIYSNPGYDVLGALVAERSDRPFGDIVVDWVLTPIGASRARLIERPSQGIHGTLADAIALATELRQPTLLSPASYAALTTVAFPGLRGMVPGVGSFNPNDWGLGLEIHGAKRPHWMGTTNSPATIGHLGVAGTFVWIDPVAGRGLVLLADRAFGPWAMDAWPRLSDGVLAVP